MYTQILYASTFDASFTTPESAYDHIVSLLNSDGDDTAVFVAECISNNTVTQTLRWVGDTTGELQIKREWDNDAYATYESMLAKRDIAESSLTSSGFEFEEFVVMPDGENQALPRD